MAQVSFGTITITDTNDIESITIEYARNQSTSTAPTSGWSTTRPDWAQGYYIWQRARIHKSGTESSSDTFGTAVCLTGSTGSTGATGRGISSIATSYCNYGTGTPAASYSGWQSTVPAYDSTKPNYWVKTVITYTTGSPATDTSIYKDNGITDAVTTSAEANATATDAWNKADDAQDDAAEALALAQNTNYAWWSLASAKTVGQNTFAAGSYGTFIRASDFQSNPTNQPNIFVDANGLHLRRALTDLASFTGTALTFNNPTSGSAQLVIGASGTLQSGNYSRGNDTKFAAAGTKIDLITGEIYTPYFRLSQGLDNVNAGAYVHGTIEALDGRIGTGYTPVGGSETNYWDIGDYTDYNLNNTAKIIGHGSSFIQLGDAATWRLSTNRIHTGWYNNNDTVLHYPQDSNNKYWDFGIHVPYSDSPSGRGNDKFIYIRTQKAQNTSLTNLLYDIDDNYSTAQWDYKFWIDREGKVHAQNFYVGNSTTPIGGGAGTIAEKLLTGAGSTTQPVYFRTDEGHVGEIATTTYQLNAAGAKGIDTSMPTTATDDNVPTTLLMKNFVEGKGYITSYTDEKVKIENKNTTKLWVTGTATAGTTTGTLAHDTNIYIDTTAGALHATTFNGYTLAAASAKGVDTSLTTSTTSTNLPTSAAVVNLIKQYLPLTGGNVTGAVTFGDSVTIDEATIGDLVVNGSASVTNNLQVNTINGVAVGNSPKFTDNNTTYTFANGTNGFTVTPSGGSAQTVTVTPSITNNVTGSGTSGYLTKWNGTNTITNGPQLGSSTTTFLRNDGTWATPIGSTYSAGSGLRLSGSQFINTRIPFVVGTQTATTGSWTGVCNDITALYDGLTIAYWLPYAGNGNATLNLTINGTATGAKNCYYGGTTRLTTHYGAGNIIYLTYQSAANVNGTNYEGWWATAQYYSDYTICYTWTAAATAAKSFSASYFYTNSTKCWFPICLIYGNTYAGAITFNINGTGAKPVYINGSASSASNYSLEKGYYLVYWDGTNFYVRTDGKITGNITGDAATVAGHTVAIDVPSNAIFTDTTYSFSAPSTVPTLSWGSETTIGSAGGVTYKVKMPSNPNSNTTYTLSNALSSHKFTSTLTPSSGTATTATQEFAAGGAITLTDDTTNKKITIAHTDTSSQASSSNSGRTYIQSITLDTYGHVTALSTATETVTDTHHSAKNIVTNATTSKTQTTTALTNGNVYLNLIENDTVRSTHKISGNGSASVTSDTSGNIIITSPVSLTGVNFEGGTITFTKSDNTTVPITTSDFVITQATGATALVKLRAGSTTEYEGYAAGGATTAPVYFNSDGHPVAVTSIPYSLLTGAPSSMTPASHTHGNIQNGGTLQTNDITIASNDKLVVTDASDSNKIARTSITFDTSKTTEFLTRAGTWVTPVTGVKGNSESTYRTGQVNITKANIGLGNVDNTADANKNVLTATKFSSARTVQLTGDVTGSASGDGSNGWSITTTVGDDSHLHTMAYCHKPIQSKTYANTSYYATSANSWETSSWYFMSVKPDAWYKPWKIRIRVHSYCPSYTNVESVTDSLITGRADSIAYSNYTERYDIAHYYIPYYTLKKAGFDAGLGHAIGISILYGTNYTNSAYYRTFEVDFLECENCTITFLDTPVKWASWTNGSTTNYNGLGNLDAVTRGYTESGDRNDVNYQNRLYYTYKKPYATLYRYQILLSRADGTLLPVNSVSNAPSNISKTLTTEEFDPFGEIYYYNTTTERSTSQNLDNNVLYRQVLADLRYSFNITNESGKCLTSSLPVYIVATPQSNGMAKLASPALVQTLPSTDDGKIYIYIGQAYPDTYPYRCELPLYHPIYWYKNGAIRQYIPDAAKVNNHTVLSDVPANAVFTDTWKALSTSQAGYVSQAPNDTSKFLRGDATWAAVTKSNVGLGSVDNTSDANKRVKGANITTTANAVAYYTDTSGTFGSKASANGALYATAANGALQWGTLPAAQGGTGQTNLKDACNALINALDTGSSNLTSNDYVITQYVGGGSTTTTYHRRPASALRVGGLLTARKLKVALGSTTDKTFDGTADVTDIPISGTLGVGHGGTGTSTAPTQYGVIYASSTSAYASTAAGSANTALMGKGSAAPAFVSVSPSISITAGTGSATPKINVTVLGVSGTAQSITTASTSVYGATKLSSTASSSEQGLAATPKLVYDSIAAASNTYVTLATDQTITASQKTFNGATRWSVTNSATGSKYGACNYDATLDALVFSFGTI